ncbi:hypothetical protein [Sulfurimonas sp.]|uniref:hypothetical protein n=1 Tax=Sulfurimonas sp. TaxID=2022749 RepID=UPI002B4A3DE1|nr:hypothetical protein [Sulfurimonas sp.]
MESLSFLILVGVVLSLGAFLFFENRAIQAHKSKDAQSDSLSDSFKQYNTSKNVVYFFISSFFITLILATVGHSSDYGLMHALLYIFTTTFAGSTLIFVLKLQKKLLIKVFATFLYGVPHIGASALAFLVKYLTV